MIWLFDIVAFALWILLASVLIFNARTPRNRDSGDRKGGNGPAVSILGLIALFGYVYYNHDPVFVVVFLALASAIAVFAGSLTARLPIWTLLLATIVSIALIGFSHLWL